MIFVSVESDTWRFVTPCFAEFCADFGTDKSDDADVHCLVIVCELCDDCFVFWQETHKVYPDGDRRSAEESGEGFLLHGLEYNTVIVQSPDSLTCHVVRCDFPLLCVFRAAPPFCKIRWQTERQMQFRPDFFLFRSELLPDFWRTLHAGRVLKDTGSVKCHKLCHFMLF